MNADQPEDINSKMILLFMGVSLFSFFFYVLRHPLFHLISHGINRSALLEIYMPDLLIYLSILFPYNVVLVYMLLRSHLYQKKPPEGLFIIFFFPLFGFFSKGMFLPHVYIELNIQSILTNNIFFFIFAVMGLFLSFIHTLLRKIYDKYF